MKTSAKFSLGEKVDHVNKNNKISKNNYIMDVIKGKDGILYKLQDEDGILFMSKSESLSKTLEVKS